MTATDLAADRPTARFTLEDCERASDAWNLSCGPAALAAALDLTLDEVRPHLGDFEKRGYMNPSDMRAAFRSLGAEYRLIENEGDTGEANDFPSHGIVRIQWEGPWTAPGANARWAYTRTHWVASRRNEGSMWVYDINAGRWEWHGTWELEIVPAITREIPRATGGWFATHRWELSR